MRVSWSGVRPAVSDRLVRRTVRAVLDGERAGATSVSVTFLSSQRMRALNRRHFDRDRSTDVIAFGLTHDGRVVADIYVCPAAARRNARAVGVSDREELVRVVVHGTLHALGHDHPDGDARTRSAMWRRQERYVRRVLAGAA